MNQFQIYDNKGNEIESLPTLNNINLKLPNFEGLNAVPQHNSTNVEKLKKVIKFITSKFGRRNKQNFKPKDDISSKKGFKHNKFCSDNVRRRIKTLYNKYIITLLNNLMKSKYKKIKLRFVKMNVRITKDISIQYNRNLLDKTIKEIVSSVSNKYQNVDNNKKCIKFIENQNDNEEILNIFNMTYKDFYTDYYLKSTKENSSDNSYEAHKECILSSDGKDYLEIFTKNAETLIEFFTKTRNRKNRKIKEVYSIDIPSGNEMVETADSVNEINNGINQIIKTNKVEMISESTQTDICDINSKLIVFL